MCNIFVIYYVIYIYIIYIYVNVCVYIYMYILYIYIYIIYIYYIYTSPIRNKTYLAWVVAFTYSTPVFVQHQSEAVQT